MTIPKEIAVRLLKAQQAVDAVEKASENKHHKYKYASAEDVVSTAREALHKAGLAVLRTGWAFIQAGEGTEAYVRVTYSIVDADGHCYDFPATEIPAPPGNGRPSDKALLGALTSGQSYFLLGLLEMVREDENDIEKRDDNGHTPRRLQQRPQQANHRAQEGGTVVLRGKFDDVTDPAELKAFIEARRQGLHEAAAKGQDIKGKIVAAADRVGVDPADALAWWGKP